MSTDVSREAKFQKQDLLLACAYAEEHENFDDTFVQSLWKQFDQRGYLTEKQYDALRKVIEAWHMED